MALNEKLKIAIVTSRRSQRAVAARASIRESRLSDIVNGWVRATPQERASIAAVLEQSEGDLFDSVGVAQEAEGR